MTILECCCLFELPPLPSTFHLQCAQYSEAFSVDACARSVNGTKRTQELLLKALRSKIKAHATTNQLPQKGISDKFTTSSGSNAAV